MPAIPNNDTRALFDSLVANRPFGQQTLLDLEPVLLTYGIQLTPPNAAGDRTKIGDPISGRWTRVGFGEGHWVWIVQSDIYTPPTQPIPIPQPPNTAPAVDLTPILNKLDTISNKLDTVGQLLAMQQTAINQLNAAVNTLIIQQPQPPQPVNFPSYVGNLFGFKIVLRPE